MTAQLNPVDPSDPVPDLGDLPPDSDKFIHSLIEGVVEFEKRRLDARVTGEHLDILVAMFREGTGTTTERLASVLEALNE